MNIHCRFHSVFHPECLDCKEALERCARAFALMRRQDPIIPSYDRARFLAAMRKATEAIADKIERGAVDVEARCAATVVVEGAVEIAVGIIVQDLA